MQKELTALEQTSTWELLPLPIRKKAIGCKWVFKVKLKADGSLKRLKARLVAKDFTQKYGIDNAETFSPVVKMAIIRCLLAVAASRKWHIHQLDINNAFLHGTLEEEVYMKALEGYHNPAQHVCRLKRSLYGLKQASRQWFARLHDELIAQYYIQSKNDYSLFISSSSPFTIAAIYVDDIILAGSDFTAIDNLKTHLHTVFCIKYFGKLNYFPGIVVTHINEGIILTQKKFTKELLQDCSLDVSKAAKTPLPINLKLHSDEGEFTDPTQYKCI